MEGSLSQSGQDLNFQSSNKKYHNLIPQNNLVNTQMDLKNPLIVCLRLQFLLNNSALKEVLFISHYKLIVTQNQEVKLIFIKKLLMSKEQNLHLK